MNFYAYVLRRVLLIIPTLLGIMAINFFIVQAAPGGPVDQAIAQMKGIDMSPLRRSVAGVARQQTPHQPVIP